MSQSGKLITVAVLLSLLAILSGLLFGQEKIPEIQENMDVWVSRQDQNILHRLSDREKELLSDILSHQKNWRTAVGMMILYWHLPLTKTAWKNCSLRCTV